MSVESELGIFTERVNTAVHRTQALYKAAMEQSQQQHEQLTSCLKELQLALEDLQIAEEELCDQTDALSQAYQSLESERQRYQDLFEFAPDAYLITDVYGTIQAANRVAGSLFNFELKFLLGKPIINFVPPDQRRSFRSLMFQLPQLNRLQEWEVQLWRRGDQLFEAALTVEAIQSPGAAPQLRWLVRDITQRKQTEARMRQIELQNLELIEASRIKDQFISTISHELRTPLNSILGFSQLLLQRFRQQQELELTSMVEPVVRGGTHLLRLVEEMLSLTRLKAEKLQLDPQPFDLADLILETVTDLRLLAERKSLEVQVQLPPDGLPVVQDITRLRQVLVNLVSNAIKFTDQGLVCITVQELPEEKIAISISDTGIGIAPEHHCRVFQEFWQVNQNMNRSQGGSGLGLAICKAIVALMQGSITMESHLKAGSTFRMELPRYLPELADPQP